MLNQCESIKKKYSYSVCIATYNGKEYIQEQIRTIAEQLDENDEIIVSDDGSTDGTLDIVEKMKLQYPFIKIINGPKQGFSCNFGNAVSKSTKDIICFSDQDDVWDSMKIKTLDNIFTENEDITTVLHSMATFRDNVLKNTSEIKIIYRKGLIKNYIKSSYWGCCMAIKRDFVKKLLPFRPYCVGHDQLIGLFSEKYGNTKYVDKNLIFHRLHNSNTSKKRTIKEMIMFRYYLMKDYFFALRQYKEKD